MSLSGVLKPLALTNDAVISKINGVAVWLTGQHQGAD
jgi:hypothetical protein